MLDYIKEDSKFHYQLLDKHQTMCHYYNRIGNAKEAKNQFENVEICFKLLLELNREIPKWYTAEDFARDKNKFKN